MRLNWPMENLIIAGALVVLVMPAASMAQSSLDGTWKVDFNSAMPRKVNVWLLQNGVYRCTSCTPNIDVKADGKDQLVKGQPYDTVSVKVMDHQRVEEIEKKNGQTVSDEKFTVSDDGNTVTDEFGNWKLIMTRIAKAPTGAHALSGSWQPLKMPRDRARVQPSQPGPFGYATVLEKPQRRVPRRAQGHAPLAR